MVALVKLVADISSWLYLLLLIISVLLLRRVNVTMKERARSIFDLERENATARIRTNLFYLFVVLLLGSGVWYTANVLIEDVPLPNPTPTPTVLVQLPATPTPPVLLPTPTSTTTSFATPPTTAAQPPALAAVTATPQPPPAPPPQSQSPGSAPNCPIPGVVISQPGNGAVVNGVVSIFGQARTEDFAYYKLEFRVPGGEWSFIESRETSNAGGQIGSWNSDTVPSGTYELRLVVVDSTGNFPEPCQVTLNVQH
jgi:hypothetical protein